MPEVYIYISDCLVLIIRQISLFPFIDNFFLFLFLLSPVIGIVIAHRVQVYAYTENSNVPTVVSFAVPTKKSKSKTKKVAGGAGGGMSAMSADSAPSSGE